MADESKVIPFTRSPKESPSQALPTASEVIAAMRTIERNVRGTFDTPATDSILRDLRRAKRGDEPA